MTPSLQTSIQSALLALNPVEGQAAPLREAALALLDTPPGYRSDKTIALPGSQLEAFLELIRQSNPDAPFDPKKALFADWKSADLLFQLTDDELSREASLFPDTEVKPVLLRSYLFFAIELKGGDYARGKLTAIARQINRAFNRLWTSDGSKNLFNWSIRKNPATLPFRKWPRTSSNIPS